MHMNTFKAGDRVIAMVDFSDLILKGTRGTVRGVGDCPLYPITVDFDGDPSPIFPWPVTPDEIEIMRLSLAGPVW